MQNINHCELAGNLTRDAELRATPDGRYVLRFGIAVNDSRKVDGEWTDVPYFFDCVLFGPRAEALSKWLVKGTKVCLDGKLMWSSWEQDGQRRSKVEINVDHVEFMSRAERTENVEDARAYF